MEQKTLLDRKPEIYGILFDLVRRSSNESEVICQNINKELRTRKKMECMLDIGAADADLSQKIMHNFKTVYAIDILPENKNFFNFLGIKGKICDWKKFTTKKKFDFILASHIFYYFKKEDYLNECDKMIKLLKPNGVCCIIINDNKRGRYAKLLNKFYPFFHENKIPFYKLNKLTNILKRNQINYREKVIKTEFSIQNKTHFISLCQFFLSKKIPKNSKEYKRLIDFYNTELYSKKNIKKMDNYLKFIWIKNEPINNNSR